MYAMPDLMAPLVGREGELLWWWWTYQAFHIPVGPLTHPSSDTTSQLQFNNKIYARAPSCRDLVPPEITFTPGRTAPTSTPTVSELQNVSFLIPNCPSSPRVHGQPPAQALGPKLANSGEGGGHQGRPGQLEGARTRLEDCTGPALGGWRTGDELKGGRTGGGEHL